MRNPDLVISVYSQSVSLSIEKGFYSMMLDLSLGEVSAKVPV